MDDTEQLRVLIADDEPLIRMDLKEILEESGYKVVAEAKDGAEAVEYAKTKDPDIIIMDIRMPNMGGLEAAEQIKNELGSGVPIVMLTAYGQPELYEKASDLGVFAYLTKPLRKADLFPAMEVAISRACEMEGLAFEVEELKEKLAVRKLIERAKGHLMSAHGLDEETAMRNLQKASMNQRKSMKEVAQDILQEA